MPIIIFLISSQSWENVIILQVVMEMEATSKSLDRNGNLWLSKSGFGAQTYPTTPYQTFKVLPLTSSIPPPQVCKAVVSSQCGTNSLICQAKVSRYNLKYVCPYDLLTSHLFHRRY